ncbi:MAG TPA: hypothetical protein VHE78_12670 [Gemmatimonadaceae bacterium]|nr:hypothetical protein [Gemmatimonadaceae bacterium]
MTNNSVPLRRELFLALVAAIVLVGVQSWQLSSAQNRAARSGLAADSMQAARDTTRRIYYIDAAVLAAARADAARIGDSLRLFERRAVQALQRADALDRALGLERVARHRLEAMVVGLRRQVVTDSVHSSGSDSLRHAVFDVRHAPYSVHAEVTLPRPPASGLMAVRVDLDTIRLEVRVGCGKAAPNGVPPARVNVVSPAWAKIGLSRVEQSPGVCAAPGATAASGRRAWREIVERFGVTVGYGAARGPGGVVVAGPSVLAGVKVWP